MANSEKDSVYSSDDEILRPVVKGKKSETIVSSSESEAEDSDLDLNPRRHVKPLKCESGEENSNSIGNEAGSCRSDIKNNSEPQNDYSDNEQSEKCAICLCKFLGQDIATPETCDHVFCLECLQEWAKNVNTCPIDRLKFNLILIRHHKGKKIIKTIIVSNSELPFYSDLEVEPTTQSQVECCYFCGEEDNDGSILRCEECMKFFHYNCILPGIHSSSSDSWQCATCENYIRLRWRYFTDVHHHMLQGIVPRLRDAHSINSGRTRSPTNPPLRTQHSSSRDFPRFHRSFLYQKALLRSILSSSDSSDEETEHRSAASSFHQNAVISSATKTRFPLLVKRRNEIFHTRNQALVSSAATAATVSGSLYAGDSDDDRLTSTAVPENFDLVGSILHSQTLLHCPDVLTLTRDGTLLHNSKQENSPRRSLGNNSSPMQNSEENSQSSSHNSSFFNDNAISPCMSTVVAKQRPLNPTQNSTTKYGETPRQVYTCSSSSTPMGRTLSYDESMPSRPALGANSSERYNNDPCSPVMQRSFCGSSTSEDIKKDIRPSKGHHSEEEVDIYSDIESVPEEDDVSNDKADPMKVAFKCDDSQLGNPNEGSDSSDNDLVIDEDMQIEEDREKAKEHREPSNSCALSGLIKNNQIICDSEESNISAAGDIEADQLTINDPQNENYVDNSCDNCYNPGDDSSHGVFHDDESNHSKMVMESDNVQKNDSGDDAIPPDSNVEMQEEYEDNSLDSMKKSYQGDASTPCTSVKSSPKSCRGETTDGFEIQCDNSVSNSEYYDNNSCSGPEESKEIYEEVSNQENENTCDSASWAGENEKSTGENNSNASSANSQADADENDQNENNSNLSFESDQLNADASEPEDLVDFSTAQEVAHSPEKSQLVDICDEIGDNQQNVDTSEPEDLADSNPAQEIVHSPEKSQLIDICAETADDDDNLDSIENASTPCMDENLDGQIENSPIQDETFEDGQEFESTSNNMEYEYEKKSDSILDESNVSEKMEFEVSASDQSKTFDENIQDASVDLGIEDISEVGSEDMRDGSPAVADTVKEIDAVEQKVASLFSPAQSDGEENAEPPTETSNEYNKCQSPHSNQSFEDHEEGEIIEERPVHRCSKNRKKKNRSHDPTGDYGEFRVNISDLPRIPKLKRDRNKDSFPEVMPFESKSRTSVLSRVDLGSADISWKRLSKHTRERSYRDGRPKDEKLLYRERESRNKEKNSDAGRRGEKNADRRRDEKKQEVEKSKSDYDSRSRKTERNKVDWDYNDREKRKSRKDKHSKEKHSKDKKDKYDKKYSKDEDKYEREKLKEDRYERDKYDKEERFERIVYEKGKFKGKEHKSKHKDRKSETGKSSKDHSREKHKRSHSNDHFSDKQREREVRKIDDKIKIVVEQKENRKEKSKHKDRKEAKHEKKQIIVPRKIEPERSPYAEVTSIESKEIFAKGDSIIINVNFNRASSPKVSAITETSDVNSKDRKALSQELEQEQCDTKNQSKHISSDKVKCSVDGSIVKRPVTPPEKSATVLSVSESYWQGGDDPDGNHTPESEKSTEDICADNENATESPGRYEDNSCGSSETPSLPKDSISAADVTSSTPEKETNKENENFSSKRRSPRSPSPPSPADNDSYDPCEPTRSPSPPPMPPAPPLPTMNPKPPPSPELPPLPPEPEPMDAIRDDPPIRKQNAPPSEFVNVSVTMVTSAPQPTTVHTQTSTVSPMAVQGMMLPPPSFLSQVSSAANSMASMSSLVPPRNGSFQIGNHSAVMLPSNHMQQVMGNNFLPTQMHGGTTLPPPPNPPNLPHMSSVPPPPPPPAGMTLLSQVRHLNIQPPLTPSSLLQSLTMTHAVNAPQLQLIHHLPPNLSGILSNHHSPIVCTSQNQSTSLPVSMVSQQGSRMVISQMSNHGTILQNQNDSSKTRSGLISLLPVHSQSQKADRHCRHSPTDEKNEVVDMEVDTPYSPGDSPSVNSVADYTPTCSPLPSSSPKHKDVFDNLFSGDQRTSEKRSHDSTSANEKSKQHSGSKKSKQENMSKSHQSARMQGKEKHKKQRKEQRDKKDSLTKLEDSQLKILDELPSSAVEMQVKEKFLKKLNRQERVVEEVKLALKPYYKSRDVTKEEYKDILRKSVPKICHNKSGEINPVKVKYLVECYVKKAKHSRKRSDKRKSSKFS